MAAELHKAAVFEDIIYFQNTVSGTSGLIKTVYLTRPITVFFQTTAFNGVVKVIGKSNIPQLLIYCQTVNIPSLHLNEDLVSITTNTTYHFVWDGTEWNHIT